MRERLPAQPPDSVDLSATLELLASLTQYAEAGAVQPHTLAQAAQHALEEHGDQIEVLIAVAKLYVAIGDRAATGAVLGRAMRVAPEDKRVTQLFAEAGIETARPGPTSGAKPRSTTPTTPAPRDVRPSPPRAEIDTRVRRREGGRPDVDIPPSSRTPVSMRAPQPARPARAGSVTVQEQPPKLDTAPPSTPRSAGTTDGPLLRPTVRMARVAASPDRNRWGKAEAREPFDSRPDRDPPSEAPRSVRARPEVSGTNPHLAKMAREAFGAAKSARAATGNLKLLDPADERRRLDRYELIGEIASGGMATVYLARLAGVAGFQRFFAIKRLHPHLADEQEFIDMFLDEARLAAGIHHPNVVPILEVGTSEAGYYLVMDYIEGDTLSGVTNRANATGGLPRPIALRILVDSLHGLAAAHDLTDADGHPMDLVHRDCSPQNILVGIDGSSRITDFGVARASSRLSTTRSATVKGKLAYLSPEQATGRGLDRRSDLFGMGVILWEALAGRRLFRADSDGATLSRILVEPIPSLAEFAPELPATLAAVVTRSLARAPDDRFATGVDMADAVEQAVRDADLTGLYVASPREVANYMRDLFGADIGARRDAIRAWSQQSESPVASGPRSQGVRRQDASPPPSSASVGGAPRSHDDPPLSRREGSASVARDVRQSPPRDVRQSPPRDGQPSARDDKQPSARSSPDDDHAGEDDLPESDRDSGDPGDQPPSSKTEPSAVHGDEVALATAPAVSLVTPAPLAPSDAPGTSTNEDPDASKPAPPAEATADPTVPAVTSPLQPRPNTGTRSLAKSMAEAEKAASGKLGASAKRPPIVLIIIAVALVAAAITTFLLKP